MCILNINTKAFSDCAEIILIHPLIIIACLGKKLPRSGSGVESS